MVSEQQAVGTVTDPNWIFYPIPDYRAGGGTCHGLAAMTAAPAAASGDVFFLTPVSILALS
jgi:hypothetical protein